MNQPRPIAELDYVAIVDEAQLCGGLIDPTAEGIVLAGPTREAVFDDRFYPGQRVWFKLRTGGVVSNALLDRWICVPRRELSHADIHAFLRDCRVPRDKGAWLHKIVGGAGWVCLLRVQPDEILDVPSTPAARARLRSLVTLDTPRRRLMWLHDGASPPRLAEPSSLSPFRDTGGLRYHFRWEHLLDIDVTVNIDERCRPGYRFAHRVAVLNRMLSLFASVMSEYQHVVRQQFTGTEIDLVAECLEHLDEVPLERVLSFLPDGIAAVAQQQARLQGDCADEVAILAERVRWLSVAERAALIDLAFAQNGVIPWSIGRKSLDEEVD